MTPPLTEKSEVTTTTLDGCTRDFKRESQRNRKMRFSKNDKRERLRGDFCQLHQCGQSDCHNEAPKQRANG
jgi:hypothetical protein